MSPEALAKLAALALRDSTSRRAMAGDRNAPRRTRLELAALAAARSAPAWTVEHALDLAPDGIALQVADVEHLIEGVTVDAVVAAGWRAVVGKATRAAGTTTHTTTSATCTTGASGSTWAILGAIAATATRRALDVVGLVDGLVAEWRATHLADHVLALAGRAGVIAGIAAITTSRVWGLTWGADIRLRSTWTSVARLRLRVLSTGRDLSPRILRVGSVRCVGIVG